MRIKCPRRDPLASYQSRQMLLTREVWIDFEKVGQLMLDHNAQLLNGAFSSMPNTRCVRPDRFLHAAA
jgi:hypothetical protein